MREQPMFNRTMKNKKKSQLQSSLPADCYEIHVGAAGHSQKYAREILFNSNA